MKTISGFSAEDTIGAVALGTFDGVHIGHQAIIREAISRAAGIGRSAVLTTNPHPLRVIAPEHAPGLLTPMPLMQRVVSSLGVDNLYVAEFTREFARLSPRDFVVEVLVKGLRTKHVVVGYNYTFGYRGEGDADMLRELGASFQMGVTVVDPVIVDDAPVSSSRIRVAVQEGELDLCRRMLGRPYAIMGEVLKGDGRGRTLGFPTANVRLDQEQTLPPSGVYLVNVPGLGFGMADLGHRPTYPLDHFTLEVNVFDWTGDLYGQPIAVEFLNFIRSERRFDSVEALTDQLRTDELSCRRYLAAASADKQPI